MAIDNDDIVDRLRKFAARMQKYSAQDIEQIKESLEFVAGKQYNEKRDKKVMGKGRAKMVFNLVRQYANQIINAYRRDPFGVNYTARRMDAVRKAQQAQALYSGWQQTHNANAATTIAVDRQVKCGVGYTALSTDYINSESFDQDIIITSLPRPDLVIFDVCKDPSGEDQRECAIIEHVSVAEATERLGNDEDWEAMASPIAGTCWGAPEGSVEIVTYYVLSKKKKKVYRSPTGEMLDYTDKMAKDKKQPELVREVADTSVTVYVICGTKVVRSTELKLSRIPVFRFAGELIDVEDRLAYVGIVHFAKDPARLINWTASLAAERIAIAPKHTRYVDMKAVAPYKGMYANANTSNTPYLPYDSYDDEGKPLQKPTDSNPAVNISDTQAAQASFQGLLSGIMGMPEQGNSVAKGLQETATEVLTRSKSSEVANYQFIDNASQAVKAMGKVWLELAQIVYDTPRTMQFIQDGKADMAEVNYQDLGILPSELEVDIQAGPMIATQRQESLNSLLALGALLGPDATLVFADDLVRNSNYQEADKVAAKLQAFAKAKLGIGSDPAEAPDPEATAALDQAQATIEQMQSNIDQMQAYIQQQQVAEQVAQIEAKSRIIVQQMADDNKVYLKQLEIAANNEAKQQELALEHQKSREKNQMELMKLYAAQPKIEVVANEPTMTPINGQRNQLFRA